MTRRSWSWVAQHHEEDRSYNFRQTTPIGQDRMLEHSFVFSLTYERLRCKIAKGKVEKLVMLWPDTRLGHYRAYQSIGSQKKLSKRSYPKEAIQKKLSKRSYPKDAKDSSREWLTCVRTGIFKRELTTFGFGLEHLRRIAILQLQLQIYLLLRLFRQLSHDALSWKL